MTTRLTPREQARAEGIPEDQLYVYPDTNDPEGLEEHQRNHQERDKPAPSSAATPDEAAQRSVAELAAERIKDGTWLNSQEFPPLEWSVPGLLPEGYCIIVAPPKAGKSWFVAGIGLACANGGKALSGVGVQERPVLYFALEDSDRRLQSRFREIEGTDHIPDLMNRVLEAHSLNELVLIAEYFQDQHKDKRAPLIVVDVLAKVNPGRSSSQSAYDADYSVGSRLQNLAKRVPGCTVLAVHHTNKGEHTDFLNSVSGTQGVTGACDAVLVLKRSRMSNEAILSVTGRDIDQEAEYALEHTDSGWILQGGSLTASAELVATVREEQHAAETVARKGTTLQKIVDYVNEFGDVVTVNDVVSKFPDMKADTVRKNVNRAAKDGLIGKQGHGVYVPLSYLSDLS